MLCATPGGPGGLLLHHFNGMDCNVNDSENPMKDNVLAYAFVDPDARHFL